MLLRKAHYLQVALNSNLSEAQRIIYSLPVSERIIIEAGTPLIKEYGAGVIAQLASWWGGRFMTAKIPAVPYIVADLKCMDRGEREVSIAKRCGASAAVALGQAPVETIDAFIAHCTAYTIDAMVDMMNVEKPYQVLRKLKKLPQVVILHRGVDEEQYAKKPLPIFMINKIKGAFNTMISVAGGDTLREVQSAVFNGADIVVVWKDFYHSTADTTRIAEDFLATVK